MRGRRSVRLVEGRAAGVVPVTDPFSVRLDLPAEPWSPRLARHALAELIDACDDGVDDERREHVLLIVTEIVANAVEHVGGTTPVTLEVSIAGRWLHASVADVSPAPPVLRPLADDGRGWGMRIVDGLAARWGVEDHPGGKAVWFELPL